jgi:Protein of unknown function (DUF4031)
VTAYVDDAMIPATVPNGAISHTSQWSHLTADTIPELHQFATKLGLRRSYFQPGTFPHYDLTRGMRFKAIRQGAQPVRYAESPDIARRCAATPEPGVVVNLTSTPKITEPETRAGKPLGAGLVIGRGRHQDTVRCGCGDSFLRPKGETYVTCLKCQVQHDLAVAGFTAGDPALRQIAEHNAKAMAKRDHLAAQAADRSARAAALARVVSR